MKFKTGKESEGKRNFFPSHLKFLFFVFLAGMVLFSLFRITLLFLNLNQAKNIPGNIITYALFDRGWLFDTTVSFYFLFLPLLILTAGYFIPSLKKVLNIITVLFICLLYVFAIAVHSTDIPYFDYFNSRLTNGILNWTEDLWLMIKARFSVPVYYPFVASFLLLSVTFCILIRMIARKTIYRENSSKESAVKKIILSVITVFIVFAGARGGYDFQLLHLQVGDAYFTDYTFTNQLGLNPVFSFVTSFKYNNVKIIKDEDAVENVQEYLNIKQKYGSPVARFVPLASDISRPNVVIFIVESFSAFKLKRYGYHENLMPFIDSIANQSVVFDNVYTDGVHTYNGVYSSLFGMPAILNEKPFISPLTAGQKFSGLSNILHKYGYRNIFFCTGDKKFDSMNGFLLNNDFDSVYDQADYPEEYNITEWGVPDHVMFDFAASKLKHYSDKPFLAVFLTISTHESCALPDWVDFKPDSNDPYDARFEYTDWAFSRFFSDISEQNFFDNTIFVFIADHGQNFDPTYDMPLSYYHTPLIYYSPALIKPASYNHPGLQIDLFPTLMGFLKLPYVNNTLGIDLVSEKRNFAYFSSDNKIGVINDDYFLIIRDDGRDGIYKYKNKDITNWINEKKELSDSMKLYTYSMLQTAKWLAEHKFISLPDFNIK